MAELWRFTQVNDYAWANGYVSGFPNFHEANHGPGVVRGTYLLKDTVAEWRDVRAEELGNPPSDDLPARFRAVNDWASANGFFSGFPNCHFADSDQGLVYGTILIKHGVAEWRDVPANEFGNPGSNDVAARFRATDEWAGGNGFAAGFPNFHEADHGEGVVYGTILFKSGMVEWQDILADVLAIFTRFSFDSAITNCAKTTAARATLLRPVEDHDLWQS